MFSQSDSKMILIADSGSTDTTWCLLGDNGYRKEIHTKGLNPYQRTGEQLGYEISTALVSKLPTTEIEDVYFYGAGCIYDKIGVMERTIGSLLRVTRHMEVNSDILAAARGLYLNRPGIACILGTGSNSCFYDGEKITQNVSSLGFILGDEGSGAAIGKNFISDLLKDQLGSELKEKFLKEYNTDAGTIMDCVYRRPNPNRYLAGFSPFILKNIGNTSLRTMVKENLKSFFRRNVMQYDYRNYPVSFIGSVAYYYKDLLLEAAEEVGISRIGTIERVPIEGLIRFHTL